MLALLLADLNFAFLQDLLARALSGKDRGKKRRRVEGQPLRSGATQGGTHLLDDSVGVSSLEGLLEFVTFGELAFRDVNEDVGNLEDVIDVGLDTASPFLDLVLVACDLRAASATCARQVVPNISTSKRLPPFFSRTIETFVSLGESVNG